MEQTQADPRSPSPSQQHSRRRFYAVHAATAILVLAAQLLISTEEMLNVLMFPLGLLVLGVTVYSFAKTIHLGPPRTKGVTLTLLLMPGCVIPFVGPISYLIVALVFRAATGERASSDRYITLFPADRE